MSGGSFGYLYNQLPERLMASACRTELAAMAGALAGIGYADDAAAETAECLRIIRRAEDQLVVMQRRLRGVWHAMEWWRSADYDEARFRQALAAYRAASEPPATREKRRGMNPGEQITLTLGKEQYALLVQTAEVERRTPENQALYWLEEALRTRRQMHQAWERQGLLAQLAQAREAPQTLNTGAPRPYREATDAEA